MNQKFDGPHSRQWWETREETNGPSAQAYWDGRDHPARILLAETVNALPGASILEVGCHAAPLLYAIASRKHYDAIAGTELSDSVLAFAKAHLPAAIGRDVDLRKAAADGLPFSDKSFDVTVTNLVLVCIGPELIKQSLSELLRVTRRYLVLAEPEAASCRETREDPYPNTMYWIRNYQRMLRGRAHLIQRITVQPSSQIGHMNEIAVFAILENPGWLRRLFRYATG